MTLVSHKIDFQGGNAVFSLSSATYTDINSTYFRPMFLLELTKYTNPKVYLEATMFDVASGNHTYLALFDQGTSDLGNASGSIVTQSEIVSSTTSVNRYRSADITPYLTDGNRYRFQYKQTSAVAGTVVRDFCIIIIEDITQGWPRSQEQIALSGAIPYTASTVTADIAPIMIWKYDADKYNATTIKASLETSVSRASGSSGTSRLSLYDITAASTVAYIDRDANNIDIPQRLRSSEFDLVASHEYKFQYVSGSVQTTTWDNAFLIIRMTSKCITKCRICIFEDCNRTTTSTASYGSNRNLYLTSDYPTISAIYAESTIKESSASYTCTAILRNFTDSTNVTGSMTTTSITPVRIRSAALTLTNNKLYGGSIGSSSTSGTATMFGMLLLIDITAPYITSYSSLSGGVATGWVANY
jgi:hypothetical protein